MSPRPSRAGGVSPAPAKPGSSQCCCWTQRETSCKIKSQLKLSCWQENNPKYRLCNISLRHGCGSSYTSEDEAKDAFVQFAASKCCCRTAAARHMVVQSLTALNTLNKEYQLQAFTESRSTLPASEPYWDRSRLPLSSFGPPSKAFSKEKDKDVVHGDCRSQRAPPSLHPGCEGASRQVPRVLTTLCLFLPCSPTPGGFVDSQDVVGCWDMAVDPPPLFADCGMHLPVPHTYRVQVSSRGCSAAASVVAQGAPQGCSGQCHQCGIPDLPGELPCEELRLAFGLRAVQQAVPAAPELVMPHAASAEELAQYVGLGSSWDCSGYHLHYTAPGQHVQARSDCLGQNIHEKLPLLVMRASRALSGSQAEEKLFPRVAVPAGYPRCRSPASEQRIPGRCFSCRGEGQVPCAWCGAKGLLLCHLGLTITWKNSVTEYVVDKNQGFPLSCFQEVTGKQLFSHDHHLDLERCGSAAWAGGDGVDEPSVMVGAGFPLNLFRQSLSGAEVHPLPLACQVTTLNFPQPVMWGAESCLALHQMQVLEETRMLRQVGMHLGTELHAEGLQGGSNIWWGPLLPKSVCKTDVSDGHATQQRSVGRGSVSSNPEGTLLWG
ncbi:uncharacterized protein ACIBXB_006715 [Morphnus guianensis]